MVGEKADDGLVLGDFKNMSPTCHYGIILSGTCLLQTIAVDQKDYELADGITALQ